MINLGVLERLIVFLKCKEQAIPLKVLIFCFHGGAVCIFPFIILHMQLLGVSIKEIALVSLITPIAALLGPIIIGLVADKLGRYGLVLVINIILMIVFYDLLLAVPSVPNKTVIVACDGRNLTIPDCTTCFQNAINDTFRITVPTVCDQVYEQKICSNGTEEVELEIIRNQYTTNICQFNVENSSSQILNSYQMCNGTGNIFTISESSICKEELNIPYSSSFYIFFLFRVVSSFVTPAAFSMLDTSILAEARKYDLSIGKQRVMVMIGYATTPLLSAALTDYYSNKIGYQSHLPAFIVGSVFLAISAIIMFILNVRVEHIKQNVVENLLHLVKKIEVILFLIMLLLFGSNFGFVEAYLFLYMNSLGSPAIALGLTITAGCTASIPVLYYSDWIHKKISPEVIYLICFIAYALRLIGYSIMTNPWWALLFETLEALNYQLMWVTSLKLFPIFAPKRMLATMTGISMASHYSFGSGIGGFLGGYFIDWYGYSTAFQIMAAISLCAGIFSFVCHRFIIKKKLKMNEFESKSDLKI